MKLTVFTPTYNRAYTLTALYDSLRRQACRDFEWIIVDDGSTDGTEQLCQTFSDDLFPIHYFKTPNRGKHVAINFGASQASGEWFFIVDSDDTLPPNSVADFVSEAAGCTGSEIGVLCGMRFYTDGTRIGGEAMFSELDCTALEFRYKYGVRGDVAEAIRTSVIRKFPFPEFEGERFCPEALLFNRIAREYKTHYFNRNVYLCEYLPDGLSAKITKIRMGSWRGTCLCYSELAGSAVPLKIKIRSWINFWRFYECAPNGQRVGHLFSIRPWAWVLRPLGMVAHGIDAYKQTRMNRKTV